MQVASRAQAAFRSVDTWVFDLDHTLYPPRFRLFDQIEARMARFMARELHLAPAEAETLRDHYHRTYGTTLAGLMAHHKVVADHWLHEVHEIDLDHVEPDHALRGAIDALPGRKVVFTNGSRRHAERVTEAVGLTGAFDALFGTEDAGLAPKPERSAYERVFAVAGVIGPRAAMFEDTPKNLKVPHAMGMQTVHVAETPEPADHIHHHTDDLTGFLSQLGCRGGAGVYMRGMDTDILIAGAGLAGQVAALRFAAQGRRVLLADPALAAPPPDDHRTAACLMPAIQLFEEAGLWEALAPHAAPLAEMRLIDAAPDGAVRSTTAFTARDIGQEVFGYNLANARMRREASARLDRVETRAAAVAKIVHRTDSVHVTFDDGSRAAARLLIACDGKESGVRRALGIGARRWDFGQRALSFHVRLSQPIGDVSTEIHRQDGPLVLVPMTDPDLAAIVWMAPAEEADRRARLAPEALAAEATAWSAGVGGDLTLASAVAQIPVGFIRAERLTDRRVALAAEAAHAMPPIGAQGLNTSLADIADLAGRLGDDPGAPGALAAYGRARQVDIRLRMSAIDMLNRTANAAAGPLTWMRRLGLGTLGAVGPVRRQVMRLGMGV